MNKRRRCLGLLGSLPFLRLDVALAQVQPSGASSELAASRPTTFLASVHAVPGGLPLAELPRLVNTSQQAGLFRATLTAAPTHLALTKDQFTEFWAFNASVPGPIIEVTEGDTLEILFVNQLNQPSALHWHGLSVPSEQDGNPQDAIAPGGQRLYRLTLPEGCAGSYWYHPNALGSTAEQVYRGLAGALIVRAKTDPLADIPERLLMCTDLKLVHDGRIANNCAQDETNGREGQFALVNGQRQPTLKFAQSGRERWRLCNACSARYLRLNLSGLSFTLVGTDGGLLERPVEGLDELLLAPAQRVEMVVTAPDQGGSIGLWAAPYQRGKMGRVPTEQAIKLLQVDFGPPLRAILPQLPLKLRSLVSLGQPMSKKRLIFTQEVSIAAGVQRTNFLINGRPFEKSRIDLISKVGLVELWEIVNESEMDHPFYLEGTQFQVIDSQIDGRVTPTPFLAWRDSANLKSGETVRLKMVHTSTGLRRYYCPILEHQNAGMMGQVMVL